MMTLPSSLLLVLASPTIYLTDVTGFGPGARVCKLPSPLDTSHNSGCVKAASPPSNSHRPNVSLAPSPSTVAQGCGLHRGFPHPGAAVLSEE